MCISIVEYGNIRKDSAGKKNDNVVDVDGRWKAMQFIQTRASAKHTKANDDMYAKEEWFCNDLIPQLTPALLDSHYNQTDFTSIFSSRFSTTFGVFPSSSS